VHPSNPSTTISQEYDDDGSGNIDAEELQSLLQASGKKVSAIEIRKLIEEVDSVENGGNGDGLISESEFLRMLRDNRGPNILSDVTRQRADGVKQRRLELEAFKMKKTEDKLEADKQKQIRKNQQLADEAARLRQANDDKARQVAEYNQREYDKTTSEKQRVEREDRERKALVKKKKQDEKDRWAAAGKKKAERIAKAKKAIQDKEDAKRIKLEKKNKGKKRFGLKGVL
jgi:Ca2+-binding EF-hand superfamily protein